MREKEFRPDFSYFNRLYPLLRLLLKLLVVFIAILNLTACKNQIDGMLNPIGIVAYQERKLFFDTLALMLIVVLPVIIMSLTFVYHYRVSHKVRDYKPNWSHSYLLESLWWGIPCVIIVVLATLTWKKTHELDPYHAIPGHKESPLVIQAIALPWKWLFIYPEQNIATVNYLELPLDQQVEFWITADNVPMSSFFIPRLGSQIYAMEGMRTRLFLVANQLGNVIGMNSMFNGGGFAEMHFPVHIVQQEQMQQWVNQIKQSSSSLTDDSYTKLLTSTVDNKPQFFSGIPNNFFNDVMSVYINSTGTIHPRENRAKYNYMAN